MEASQPIRRHVREGGHNFHPRPGEADEAEASELIEVDGPGKGTAALSGSGEPE
jgi:hypothetical protein